MKVERSTFFIKDLYETCMLEFVPSIALHKNHEHTCTIDLTWFGNCLRLQRETSLNIVEYKYKGGELSTQLNSLKPSLPHNSSHRVALDFTPTTLQTHTPRSLT